MASPVVRVRGVGSRWSAARVLHRQSSSISLFVQLFVMVSPVMNMVAASHYALDDGDGRSKLSDGCFIGACFSPVLVPVYVSTLNKNPSFMEVDSLGRNKVISPCRHLGGDGLCSSTFMVLPRWCCRVFLRCPPMDLNVRGGCSRLWWKVCNDLQDFMASVDGDWYNSRSDTLLRFFYTVKALAYFMCSCLLWASIAQIERLFLWVVYQWVLFLFHCTNLLFNPLFGFGCKIIFDHIG